MFCEADDISFHQFVQNWSDIFTQVLQTTGIGQTFAVTLHKPLEENAWFPDQHRCGCEQGKGQTNSKEMSLFLTPKVPPDHPPFLWINEYFFQAAPRFLGI